MDPAQPSLSKLFADYLERQLCDQESGLGRTDTQGEVVPFEAVSLQPVQPRLAWEDACAVLRFYQLPDAARSLAIPPDWANLVSGHEPEVALPFCLGNFPQMVRHLPPILQVSCPASLRIPAAPPAASRSLLDWVNHAGRGHPLPPLLLVVALLRLAGQHDLALAVLQQHRVKKSAKQYAAWANEEAALAWHRGQFEQARVLWHSQTDSVPVLFNRGMADLFLGLPDQARSWLKQAIAQLAEDSGWYHLGNLYLTLAEMRN